LLPDAISEKDFRYKTLSAKKIKKSYSYFKQLLDDFSMTIESGEIEVNLPMVCRIFVRVDQRKDYYMYYHSTAKKIMKMSHEKELALWAYWICKYKPINFVDSLDDEHYFNSHGCAVSDAFASYIIISAVCAKNKKRAKYFSERVVKELYYDLANRDFSKEAIISKIADLIG